MWNNDNKTTTTDEVATVSEVIKDDIFGDREVVVEAIKGATEVVRDKADGKTVSSIQRAKDKLADLQNKMKLEMEAIKKLEKQEALKADKELAVLVRNFHATGFSDFNGFKASIKKLLDK